MAPPGIELRRRAVPPSQVRDVSGDIGLPEAK